MTVLGLSVIAKFLVNGCGVTVWNMSPLVIPGRTIESWTRIRTHACRGGEE